MQPLQRTCKQQTAKDHRTMCATAAQSNCDAAESCSVKMRTSSFCARLPSQTESWRCAASVSYTARAIRPWSGDIRDSFAPIARQTFPIHLSRHVCPEKHFSPVAYRAKIHFVRDFPQNLKVEDVTTKLSCDTSPKADVKDVTTKLSCQTSLKAEVWRCENKAFVQSFPYKLKVKDVKTKLSCETSLLCDFFTVRLFAVGLLCCETSVLCCESCLMWDLFAVRLLSCEITLLWDLFAVRLLSCK